MPVAAADVQFRYSGGAANTDPNACLGGAMSTAGGGVIDDAVLHDLWDAVSSTESGAGDVEYRGFYIKNNHGTITLEAARFYISAGDSLSDMDFALADEAVNVAMETIGNESTAPVGPVFTHPIDYAGGLQLNGATGLTAGSFKGVWARRTIAASTAGQAAYSTTYAVQGDSL